MDLYNTVFETGIELINKIKSTQRENIEKAVDLFYESFTNDKQLFITGSGHSHTMTEELYGRAGVLACFKPIMTNELTLNEHPTKSSYIERLSGYASICIELYGIKEGDTLLVTSNSGINSYPVEMALLAKEKGAKVIAVTNMNHSTTVNSRHASGKKLYEIADVVIDNCGVKGDASLKLEGMAQSVYPTSSIANTFIAQTINVLLSNKMIKDGIEPPVFMSLNVEGNELVNEDYFKKYTRLY